MRLLAILSKDLASSKVRHYAGFPPSVTGGSDKRQELTAAEFLVIDENQDGIFLYRYGKGGDFAGDTWHRNVDDAKHQASYEYGERVKDWADVPAEVEDVVAFGVSRIASVQ